MVQAREKLIFALPPLLPLSFFRPLHSPLNILAWWTVNSNTVVFIDRKEVEKDAQRQDEEGSK